MNNKVCQTIDFYQDWPCINVLRVFFATEQNLVSQEDMLRQTGLRKDALENAINRINKKINNCIAARPEYDNLPPFQRLGKGVSDWMNAEFEALFYGKWNFNSRRALGYKLADNIEIQMISKDNAIVRVFKNGN